MQHAVDCNLNPFIRTYVDTLGLGVGLRLWGGGGLGEGQEDGGENNEELHLDQEDCWWLCLIEDLEDL